MKIEYELTPQQKVIIHIIALEESNSFSYTDLRSSVLRLGAATKTFDEIFDFSARNPEFLMGLDKISEEALRKDISGLEFLGYLALDYGNTYSVSPKTISLNTTGKEIAKRLQAGRRVILRPNHEQRTTIFIASAFGRQDTDLLFNSQLAPACASQGYESIRIDMSEPSQTITELMMTSINAAECIVADLTYARPSVYFEVGYAHGLGIPLLLTCRKDHHRGNDDAARIHFDLEQYKISYWTLNDDNQFEWEKGMDPKNRLQSILSNNQSGK